MNTILVRIPCRRFGVRVTLGQSEGLSTFEAFTLRLIAGGISSVEHLAEMLTLPLGVVLDTCVDLLRAGYIFLDHSASAVNVTDVVLDEMGDDPVKPNTGWTLRLAPAAAPNSRAYDLLQDLVSGAVFPSVAGLSSQRARLVAPENLTLGEVADIQKPQLLAAASRLLKTIAHKHEERDPSRPSPLSRRGMRVTDVAIVGRSIGETIVSSPASIVVEITQRHDDDERPNLVVVGPPELDGSVRRGLASRLMAMWDDGTARDKGQFFDRLAERLTAMEIIGAESIGVQALDPALAAADLMAEVKALDDIDLNAADNLLDQHQRIVELDRRATADLDDGQPLQADASLVINAAEHHQQLMAALREAKNQVVLVCPWVGQIERNAHLRDALVEAVDRGVRVHLLWGMDRAARFEDQFGPISQELVQLLSPRDQKVGGLFVATRAAGVHTKLIVCDTEWAIVSSCNVLNSSESRREFELGVKIRPLQDKAVIEATEGSAATAPLNDDRSLAAVAVCDFLRFARSILPDYLLRNLIGDDPTLDGRRILAPPVEIGGEIEAPDYPAIWLDTVRRRAETVKQGIERLSPLAQPVMDGQHREFLVAALQTARRRIMISSKDLGIGLLGRTITELVLEAQKRGVDIKVVHAGHAEWSEDLQRRKEDLERAGVMFMLRDVHAKVLVCDGWVIVSSFNFLSFAGYYDMHQRARHELGVRLVGGGFADRVAELLMSANTR